MATDYSNRDYSTIKQDLLLRATQIVPEWTSRETSDFGMVMVDLWAYFADVLHYYIDRAADESFIDTATQRESLLALANLYDYTPNRQKASNALVTIDTSAIPNGVGVTIPAKTVLVAPATSTNPIVYFSTTVSASVTNAESETLSVVEGEYVVDENLGNSNGNSNQVFKLFYKNVIANSIEISVYEGILIGNAPTAEIYRYVENVTTYGSTDKVFSIDVNANGETLIVFGNNINGKVPATGQTITATYRKGKGIIGNVGVNKITTFYSSPSPYLSSMSSTAATGGSNAETMESMRVNIPAAFAAQNRAVSLQDYKDLTLTVPGVAKATVEYASVSNTTIIHAVPFISDYLTTVDNVLTLPNTTASDIIKFFEPRSLIGASVSVDTTTALTAVNVTAVVYVKDGYVSAYVLDAVKTALDTLFAFDNVSFAQTLSKGTIYRTILNVDGVDYVTISAPSTETVASGAYNLLKKGTYNISTVGGVTGS
ncbi:Baseplate protein J-like [uncultured Caudovirales phage]|uniref:Baseplate protein J-like n=1 Tax=uncultured Caudovirales phage TaxID=2100421 RepID=A0A6J7WZT7_9CAUD|nr:Baseplate protein J-like [uncultured Caudovirales phage]